MDIIDGESSIRKIQENQFKVRMDTLKDGFAAMEKLNVRTIPENIFLYHFLPFFCGENTENANDILSNWYVIAGTNYSAVNIVNEFNEFIIQVPPLHDKNVLQPISDRKLDLAYTFTLAKEKASLSPHLANNIITSGLEQRYANITSKDTNNTILNQWIALFKHYGKTAKWLKEVENKKADDEDEFEF